MWNCLWTGEERIFPLVKVLSAYAKKFVWFLDFELWAGGNSVLSVCGVLLARFFCYDGEGHELFVMVEKKVYLYWGAAYHFGRALFAQGIGGV
jgi:hypothetical protein